jgi:L-ascorbate metabolism protein UlaG (beta-lactamase superfamily)
VLIEIDGFRLLTDPVWSERVSPITSIGPKRFHPIPVAIRDLPPIDVVLISHDHFDHLDYQTVISLARLKVPFVVSLGVGAHLEYWGIPAHQITELDWWESYTLPYGDLTITATPAQHFSGRWPRARNDTLWSSFSVKSDKHSFFFSGDTGLTPEFEEIQRRMGRFDLVMLEIGAYHPYWAELHLGPKFAVDALHMLGGGCLLPIHWGTFNLSTHPWDDPAEKLYQTNSNLTLAMPLVGAPVVPSRVDGVTPWWRSLL